MKALLVTAVVAAVAVFAWRTLPSPEPAQRPDGTTIAATGTGVVQRVNAAAAEVTIRHGPIPALNMMAMTMSFRVRNPGQLAALKPQQQVEFLLTFDGSDFLIIDIR